MPELFSDWRRPTFITSVNPGRLGADRILTDLHPRIELVELRLDGAWAALGAFRGSDADLRRAVTLIEQAHKLCHRPILATFRTEGTGTHPSIEAYLQLIHALSGHCDYIDIESAFPTWDIDPQDLPKQSRAEAEEREKLLRDLLRRVHQDGTKAVLSRHCWDPSPDNPQQVLEILNSQVLLGADISKAAFLPQSASQLQAITQAGKLAYQLIHRPTILIGMGELGGPTRLAGPQQGNWGTFVTTGEEPASAPGQLPLAQLELRYPHL